MGPGPAPPAALRPPYDGHLKGPGSDASPHDVTVLLRAWSRGDLGARDRLVPLVYAELRRRAAHHLRHERSGHTLQPTALVHEAYIRLMEQRDVAWENRVQFFALASQMMRRILVDHARVRAAAKRPRRAMQVTLAEEVVGSDPRVLDVMALDESLDQLASFDPRQAQVVELRFFGGLTHEEIASVLGVSLATVNREWRVARAWLYQRLNEPRPPRAPGVA
jgi:RNA polymerase sigma-70 factor, ECF subfamily